MLKSAANSQVPRISPLSTIGPQLGVAAKLSRLSAPQALAQRLRLPSKKSIERARWDP